MRYPDDEETHVRAYEWCAELREAAASELPDAVAYGMAYCFERTDGMPVAGKWDLMTAADYLADVDLLQVNAFFEQHQDAEALIEAGDLAFVWLWERRSGARAGAGQACLRAALTDLRRRLRQIRTVVVDLKPYQFVVSDGAGMPTSLARRKARGPGSTAIVRRRPASGRHGEGPLPLHRQSGWRRPEGGDARARTCRTGPARSTRWVGVEGNHLAPPSTAKAPAPLDPPPCIDTR